MALAEHWLILNGKDVPVKCAVGKKADKAKAEAAKMSGYSVRKIERDHCPFCSPKAAQDRTEAVAVTYEEPEIMDKPGQCHFCKTMAPGQYKLKFHQRLLIRECKLCGAWYDLSNLKPWEGTRT